MSDPHKGPLETGTQKEDHLKGCQEEGHREEDYQEENHLEGDYWEEETQMTTTASKTEFTLGRSVATLTSLMEIEQRQRNFKWSLVWPR